MATPPSKNAIERRIDELGDLWDEFADNPNARLLRWLTDADTARMVDLFLEVQNEEAGDLPDLFIRFDVPFEDGRRHGFSLLTSFRKQYEEIRAGIAEERIPADWTCPDGRAGESDIVAFGRACISFRRYYDELMRHLVLVLTPEHIENGPEWSRWLLSLVRSGLPQTCASWLWMIPGRPPSIYSARPSRNGSSP